MPPLAPLPPDAIRKLLEDHGLKLITEDDHNWAFAASDADEPIIVPRGVDVVPFEVAQHVLSRIGFDAYSDAVHKQADPWPSAPPDQTTH